MGSVLVSESGKGETWIDSLDVIVDCDDSWILPL